MSDACLLCGPKPRQHKMQPVSKEAAEDDTDAGTLRGTGWGKGSQSSRHPSEARGRQGSSCRSPLLFFIYVVRVLEKPRDRHLDDPGFKMSPK